MPSSGLVMRLAYRALRDELRELDHAVREAPLVVVPGEDLGELVAHHLRHRGVEDRRVRVADEVAADERDVDVLEDALERALGGRLHRRVDRVLGHRPSVSNVRSTRLTSIVGTRTAWPSNLPLSEGMTSDSALAAPVLVGTMFDRRGARAAEVALAVRDVEDGLVVRVRVDGRHQPALDAERVEQDLGDGREAVRRARAARDDGVLRGS